MDENTSEKSRVAFAEKKIKEQANKRGKTGSKGSKAGKEYVGKGVQQREEERHVKKQRR